MDKRIAIVLALLIPCVASAQYRMGNSYAYGTNAKSCIASQPSRTDDSVGTVFYWAKPTALPLDGGRVTVMGWQANQDTVKYVVAGLHPLGRAYMNVRVSGDTGGDFYSSINAPPELAEGGITNEWHSGACSVNGSSSKVYIDGQIGSNWVVTGSDGGRWAADTGNNDALSMGSVHRKTFNNLDRGHFVGDASGCLVWNVQLTDAQIGLIHNTRGRYVPREGLVSVHNGSLLMAGDILDTNTASIANDLTGALGTPQGFVTTADIVNRRRRRQ